MHEALVITRLILNLVNHICEWQYEFVVYNSYWLDNKFGIFSMNWWLSIAGGWMPIFYVCTIFLLVELKALARKQRWFWNWSFADVNTWIWKWSFADLNTLICNLYGVENIILKSIGGDHCCFTFLLNEELWWVCKDARSSALMNEICNMCIMTE